MKETLKIVLINRFEKLLSDYHQDFKVKKIWGMLVILRLILRQNCIAT